MDNVKFVESIDSQGQTVVHAIIDRGNGEFTSILNSTWDELQAQKEAGLGGTL